jgi:metal-responsive CopG/Arc/MetJ family transcriptional regulator
MKTAISIPDETFVRVEHRARELGVSRSEFFARAAEHWLEALDDERTTEQIDAALAAAQPAEGDAAFVRRAGARLTARDERW